MLILILAAIIVAIFATLILYARWNYGVLESMGIPVIKPHFLLGSTYNIHKEVVAEEDIARLKKYGPIYGVYEGREAQIHICDSELIKCITAVNSDSFNAKRNLEFGSPLLNEMPDFLPDYEKWKFVRQMTTPTLTPAKIKAMSGSMNETLIDFAEELKSQLKKNGDKPINIDPRQTIFTMLTDLITRCVFNIKIGNASDSNNFFAQIVKRLVEGDGTTEVKPNILLPLSLSFPFLRRFIPPIFNPKAADDFVKTFKDILETRKKSGRIQKDYTEIVLGWMDQLDSLEFKNADISELTLMCQALVMYFAAQDQISSILTNLFLEASRTKEIQTKIFQEIDIFLTKHNGKIEYGDINELTYLTACLNESLRKVPFFFRLERVCTKDWEKDGLKIKKGMTVIMPIWSINRNPEYFIDPEKFDPERFMPENKSKLNPYAFASFGFGPRNCIGQRFAYDALVMIAAHVYKEFQFKCNGNPKVNFLPGSLFITPCQPIRLDISKRDVKK